MSAVNTFFILSLLPFIGASRTLIQSQCVFRHGARAPVDWIIPPYDEYFLSVYNARVNDLSSEGELQHKAFGEYLRKKYLSNKPYFFSGNYYFYDESYAAISTTNSRRTHQSVQSLLSELYPNEPTQIYTKPLSQDLLLVDSSCLNFGAELNFQDSASANYAQTLFDSDDNAKLFPLLSTDPIFVQNPNLTCADLGAACYLQLFDEYLSISFHREHDNVTINDNGISDILDEYSETLEMLYRYNAFKPYTSAAHNIGFELLNEITNHLSCTILNHLLGVPCVNANNQTFEQPCEAGFCGLVFYSAHDSTLRSLAHQMGILTEDDQFTAPPFASSICFDLYAEDAQTMQNQTVDILYGYPIQNDSSTFGYDYVQQFIKSVDDVNMTSLRTEGIVSSCNGLQCELTDIMEYRDSRMRAQPQYGCCTLNGNAKTYFDAVGCNQYNLTTKQITKLNGGYDTCSPYRELCPMTACGDDMVYAPSLQKCVVIYQSQQQ